MEEKKGICPPLFFYKIKKKDAEAYLQTLRQIKRDLEPKDLMELFQNFEKDAFFFIEESSFLFQNLLLKNVEAVQNNGWYIAKVNSQSLSPLIGHIMEQVHNPQSDDDNKEELKKTLFMISDILEKAEELSDDSFTDDLSSSDEWVMIVEATEREK